ncbi:MAG: ABC transporter substrate-binding protein [Caldilineaceae bacterium]
MIRSSSRHPARIALLLILLPALIAGCIAPAPADQAPDSASTNAAATDAEPAPFVCPPANPRLEVTSTELNLYTFAEYVPDDHVRCFEEAYGITVNRDVYSTNSELYAKLASGASSYDVVQPTDYILDVLIRQELLQPLDKSRLTVFDGLDPAYLDQPFDPGNEFTVPYQAGTYAIAVNTDAVATVPDSWADLWNAEYAGRLTFLDDARSVIGLTMLTLGHPLNSTDPLHLDEAQARLLELVPNIKLFESDNPKAALLGGDVDLGMVWTGEAVLAQRENPAITYVYPSEGAILWQDNYAIPATAPHTDAAHAFINYTLQPELFWLTLRDFPYTNPNAAALEWARTNQPALYDAYINSPITNMPTEDIARGHRLEDVGAALPEIDRIWTEVKGQ